MIKATDITNFGSFHNFVWRNSIRDKGNNVVNFKKFNILYGRNYSGKTTLSRILRSLEIGILPENYETPSFSVTTSSGLITHKQIPAAEQNIRVYNTDFVDDHLSFLRDANGKIVPFAIIGSENKTIEAKIDQKEKELGSQEEETGLRYKYANKQADYVAKQIDRDNAKNALNQKLVNKANQAPDGIKHNPIYRDVTYDIRKIKADIKTVQDKSIEVLTEEERRNKETLLNETPLPDIENVLQFNLKLSSLCLTATELLSKTIKPSKPIQELLEDAILQAWVKEGVPLHRDKRENCGFCGNPLPDNIWDKIDEHFSKESGELERALNDHIDTIEEEKEAVDNIIKVDSGDLYSTFRGNFDKAKVTLEKELNRYNGLLDKIMESLHTRISDIFTSISIPEITNNSKEISTKIDAVNVLIEQHNNKTETLEHDQASARTGLRLSEIAQFIQNIDLMGEEKRIKDLEREVEKLKSDTDSLHGGVREAEQNIEELRIQLTDEKKGAEKVNEYLNNYFGHDALHLQAVEDTENSMFKFQILRGDKPAYNLSEGECSLVSFCYFMAKLDEPQSKGKKLIIYIDDPVSSLDNNHIFFVYSLIENLIAKPVEDADGNRILDADRKNTFRYEQLFISTHNLEFLKFLKRLSKPPKDHEHFLVSGNEDGSNLELMPDYLRKYITELNYLFGEIYNCSDPTNATDKHHSFYNFGNNLRKFLEAFLFFKYPFAISDKSDYADRIKKFFKDVPSSEPLILRLTNEFSHLGNIIDRGFQPIDHAEISKLAKFVLKKIKDNDSDQFDGFLESVGASDPFIAGTDAH